MASPRDCILLVPGFFGFGAFGRSTGHPIRYFEDVERSLARAHPALAGRIHVHEPPPTASLSARVHGLALRVLELAARYEPDFDAGGRLHVVGHSAGGVDARLLANRRYATGAGPHRIDGAVREYILRRLGRLVTVASPLHGTPIARRHRWLFRRMLDAVFLASFLDRLHPGDIPRLEVLALLEEALFPGPDLNDRVVRLLASLDPVTVRELRRFRSLLLGDDQLLDDLTPEHMARLNEEVAGGDALPLHHFATVAPPPPRPAALLASLARGARGLVAGTVRRRRLLRLPEVAARQVLYAVAYWSTADSGFAPAAAPAGPLLGGDLAVVERCPRANDGIVPLSSQTLDGRTAGVVVSDHLDVIGHYESPHSTTLFQSGASFDDKRFAAFWQAVAGLL